MSENFTPAPTSIVARLTKLEGKRGKGKATKRADAALAAALKRSARRTEDPALEDFREDLFAELRKMIKPAIAQAKKGKPALLRILTRYSR
jgi:hypothetical protein